MTPLWMSLATSAVIIGQPAPTSPIEACAPVDSPAPACVLVVPLETDEPTWEETLSGAGRVWTDTGMDRIAPSSMGRAERVLAFTPGARVDGSGQLWLSGSRVHTIYLDGVAIDVERIVR